MLLEKLNETPAVWGNDEKSGILCGKCSTCNYSFRFVNRFVLFVMKFKFQMVSSFFFGSVNANSDHTFKLRFGFKSSTLSYTLNYGPPVKIFYTRAKHQITFLVLLIICLRHKKCTAHHHTSTDRKCCRVVIFFLIFFEDLLFVFDQITVLHFTQTHTK